MTSSRALLASALALLTVGGCFSLDRALGIEPGSVGGAAVDEDGARLRDVVVGIEGTGAVRRAADGAFLVAGLPAGTLTLRLTVDADNDGVVDRGARVPFVLGVEADRVGFVLFGDVTLPKTATIRGRVVDGDGVGVAGARVVAAAFDGDVVTEATAAVDSGAGGVFVLRGVLAGEVTVVASGTGTASVAVERTVAGGDDVDVGDVEVLGGGADANVTVTVRPDIEADIAFVRRPGDGRTQVPADVAVVAPGVFDIEVEADGASNGRGVLNDIAVPRGRPSLQVVVVLEGVAPGGSTSGGGPGDPPDTGVDAGVDPGEQPPLCETDVVIENGTATPAPETFERCPFLRSLTIINGTPDTTTLDALRTLTSVRGDVVIEGTGLTDLAFLGGLTDIKQLTVRENPALTRIELPSLQSVQNGIVIDTNGTTALGLNALSGTTVIELADLPLQSVQASAPGIDVLRLRGTLGAPTSIYAAFSSARRIELIGVVAPVLPGVAGRELLLSDMEGVSFASLSAVRQMRQLDVVRCTIDVDDLNAWDPDQIDIVSFIDNVGASDTDITAWIGRFAAPPSSATISGNTSAP